MKYSSKTQPAYTGGKKPRSSTSSIMKRCYCAACGWPVVHACVNDEFVDFVQQQGIESDWWAYCTNKGCVNHAGEDYFQCPPEWILIKQKK